MLKSKHKLYHTWRGMFQRCENPNCSQYKNYGARGIGICDRWKGDKGFQNFIADMGEKPSSKHSIDRIKNDGNYEPKNCRWATNRQQSNNRRMSSIFVPETQTKFGDWVFTGKARKVRSSSGQSIRELLVTCKCGRKKWVTKYSLFYGRSKMCKSCTKKRNLQTKDRETPRTFGLWKFEGEVVRIKKKGTPHKYYVVTCKCGLTKKIAKYDLTSGRSKGCINCNLEAMRDKLDEKRKNITI